LLFAYRGRGIIILVSRSFDGEVISAVLDVFGFSTVRGSSSRGGMVGLIQIIERLRSGGRVAFTPDGPRGPKEKAKYGVGGASVKSGAPVFAVEVEVDRKWILKTWDEFIIPKPFANITIRYSNLMFPGDDDSAKMTQRIQSAFDHLSLTH